MRWGNFSNLALPVVLAVFLPGTPHSANTITSWTRPLYLNRCSYNRPIQLPTDQSFLYESMVRVSGDGKSALGVVVSPDGHVLTSGSVAGAGSVRIELPGGRTASGSVLRLDLIQDIALVKMPRSLVPGGQCLTLGRNNTPSIGTKLFLLTRRGEDAREVEVKSHRIWNRVAYFRTGQSPGNGTPVVNKNGTVVGVITRNLSGPKLKGKALGVPLSSIKQRLCLAWRGERAPVCKVDTAVEFKKVTGRDAPEIKVKPAPVAKAPERPGPQPRRPALSGDSGTVDFGGLIWTACSRGQTYSAGSCRGLSQPTNWDKAERYCDKITNQGRRWRLPTRQELETLIEAGAGSPKINVRAFPRTAPQPYWSATDFRAEGVSAWYVNFRNGSSYGEWKTKHLHVRCVAR